MKRKKPQKPYRKYTNYYLNTIKGNKFMFLHCLYKTNKEEKKKTNKTDSMFYFGLDKWLRFREYTFFF